MLPTATPPDVRGSGIVCSIARIGPKAVLHNFPPIAAHIIQPPHSLYALISHNVNGTQAVAAMPCIRIHLLFTEWPQRSRPLICLATIGVLPFRFRRQPELPILPCGIQPGVVATVSWTLIASPSCLHLHHNTGHVIRLRLVPGKRLHLVNQPVDQLLRGQAL